MVGGGSKNSRNPPIAGPRTSRIRHKTPHELHQRPRIFPETKQEIPIREQDPQAML
jgi:hypothetical protein